jgi:hypothetical protein
MRLEMVMDEVKDVAHFGKCQKCAKQGAHFAHVWHISKCAKEGGPISHILRNVKNV